MLKLLGKLHFSKIMSTIALLKRDLDKIILPNMSSLRPDDSNDFEWPSNFLSDNVRR